MEHINKLKKLSIFCSILGFLSWLFYLIIGLDSRNASGWDSLGTILIKPSIIALIIIVIDFLITIDVIKHGYKYSYIISVLKVVVAFLILVFLIKANSDFNLQLIIMIFLPITLITIPSLINIKKYEYLKKEQIKN